jgi:hypothetical protein
MARFVLCCRFSSGGNASTFSPFERLDTAKTDPRYAVWKHLKILLIRFFDESSGMERRAAPFENWKGQLVPVS